jgi:hypothetical protein
MFAVVIILVTAAMVVLMVRHTGSAGRQHVLCLVKALLP